MKKLISVLLSVIIVLSIFTILPFSVSAATIGDYSVKLLADGTVEITNYLGDDLELTIPSNLGGYDVTSIGTAFYECESLKSITIPYGVSSINDYAFYMCENLERITIPNSVTSIGESAFENCYNLTSVTIPDSVTSMGRKAFYNCGITSVKIGSGINSIPYCAFSSCDNLTSIVLPDDLIHIGKEAFEGCWSLASITIPDSVIYIEQWAFKGTAIYYDKNNWEDDVLYIGKFAIESRDSLLQDIKIKEGTIVVAELAFERWEGLKNITFPDSVTHIGWWAFLSCSGLESVKFGNKVTSIGRYAFENCTSLTSVTVPKSVTEIGDNAFGYYYDNEYFKKLEGFTIYGYEGSAADDYAWNNNFDFVKLTEEPTEPATKEPTQPATDKPTEPVETQPTTNNPTEPAETQPATDKPTEPTTEAQGSNPYEQATWTVAGNIPNLGESWKPANNPMTKGDDGLYTLSFENVAAGEYNFKVTNGTWDETYGNNGNNFYVRLTDVSDLTIKFNADTKEITVEGTNVTTKRPVVEIVPGYYVTGSKGLCGKDWANKADSNTLMFKGEDGNYYKDFTNIAAGSYEFKIIYVNAYGNVFWHPGGMGNDSVVNVKTDGSLVRVSYTPVTPAEHGREDDQEAGVATVYADSSQAPEIKPYVEPATVPTEATEPTTAEQEIVKGKNNADIREAVPSEIKTKTLYFYMPQEWRNTYNDTYDGNSLDSCSAGIYWWEGPYNANDYSNGWPGYNITERDHSDNNIFVARVPVDLWTVIFNNTVDGGSASDRENEPERYAAALQTDNITAEYYMPNEDGYGFYPIGTEDCDGMIYVCNLKDTQVNPFSEKRTYKGAWFYYYGNGKYGKYKTLEQAKMYNAVYSGGQWPGDPHPTEPPTETVEPTTVVTQPATEATESTTNTTESTEPITEATEPATTVPVETRTFNFLPDSELAKSADSFKLVIQDTKNNMHTYDFVATGIKIDGVKIYTANVPVDFDIAQVQYQMYKGETWLGQMVKSASEISEIGESIVRADGTIINTNEPSTEPTELATTETEATEPTSTEPAETQSATDKPTEPEITEPTQPVKKDISAWTVNGIVNKTYTGKVVEQNFYVVSSEGECAKFKASYRNNKEVGTATVIIVGIGDYTGTITKTFSITKADNPVVVKTAAKTVKLKKLKKKNQVVKAITVKNAQGSVTYKLVKKGITKKIRKFVKINSNGVITIKKWKKAKKGKYTIAVKITAKGNNCFNAKSYTKMVKIRVK